MHYEMTNGFRSKIKKETSFCESWTEASQDLETQTLDWLFHRWKLYRGFPYVKLRDSLRALRILGRFHWFDTPSGSVPVLFVLDGFQRQSKDYRDFLSDITAYGQQWEAEFIGLRQKVDVKFKTSKPQPPPIPPVPDSSLHWIRELPGWTEQQKGGDYFVLETQCWNNYMRAVKESHVGFVFQSLKEIVITRKHDVVEGWSDLFLHRHRDVIYVLYTVLPLPGPVTGILLLWVGTKLPTSELSLSLISNVELARPSAIASVLNACQQVELAQGIGEPSAEQRVRLQEIFSTFITRAYPWWVFVDFEVWDGIRNSREGVHLLLSVEEYGIMDNLANNNNGSLPVFISGGAGSGKSTLLMYLFTYYFKRLIMPGRENDRLLFIAYSKFLLNDTKDLVRQTLTAHPEYQIELTPEAQLRLDKSFTTFTGLLMSILREAYGEVECQRLFPAEGRITFAVFKALYTHSGLEILDDYPTPCNLPERRRWGPEHAWFLVRSVIQGESEEDYVTPDDFVENRPLAAASIAPKDYKDFYDTIWDRWYRKVVEPNSDEKGIRWWDDQTLVRFVLQKTMAKELVLPQFSVIFCDEAQDFTPVEYCLILRLFAFRHYRLSASEVNCLPLAFAGDAHQTLHPTGFSWGTLQQIYHEEILTDRGIGLRLNNTQRMRFRPVSRTVRLSTNYRSSGPITRFLNSIQLFRRVELNQSDIVPQDPRNPWYGRRPRIIDMPASLDEPTMGGLIKKLRNMSILLNCEEEGKEETIKNDAVLRRIFCNENGTVTGNLETVFTPFSAKGLNLKRVVLWKFAGSMPNPNADALSIRYFYNRFYVAASRATEELLAIEDQEVRARLWEPLTNKGISALRNRLDPDHASMWEHIVGIHTGNLDDLHEYSEAELVELAETTMSMAILAETPDNTLLALRAQRFYSRLVEDFPYRAASYRDGIDYCGAWLQQFGSKLKEAGETFLRLGRYRNAFNAFWHGLLWDDLWNMKSDWPSRGLEVEGANYTQIILYMCGRMGTLEGLDLVDRELKRLRDSGKLISPQVWALVERFAEQAEAAIEDLDQGTRRSVAEVLDVKERVPPVARRVAGRCYYLLEDWANAVLCFEAVGLQGSPEYLESQRKLSLARAQSEGYPQGLRHLDPAAKFRDEILSAWETHGRNEAPAWLLAIGQIYSQRSKNHEQAVQYLVRADSLKAAMDLVEQQKGKSAHGALAARYLEWTLRCNKIEAFLNGCKRWLSQIPEPGRAGLAAAIISGVASSQLKPDDFLHYDAGTVRDELSEFVEKNRADQLSVKNASVGVYREIQAALERIGRIQAAIRFSLRFCEAPSSELRELARQRHILALHQDLEYWQQRMVNPNPRRDEQGKGEHRAQQADRAQQAATELDQKCRDWGIDDSKRRLGPRFLSVKDETPDARAAFELTMAKIDVGSKTPNEIRKILLEHGDIIQRCYNQNVQSLPPVDCMNFVNKLQENLRSRRK